MHVFFSKRKLKRHSAINHPLKTITFENTLWLITMTDCPFPSWDREIKAYVLLNFNYFVKLNRAFLSKSPVQLCLLAPKMLLNMFCEILLLLNTKTKQYGVSIPHTHTHTHKLILSLDLTSRHSFFYISMSTNIMYTLNINWIILYILFCNLPLQFTFYQWQYVSMFLFKWVFLFT